MDFLSSAAAVLFGMSQRGGSKDALWQSIHQDYLNFKEQNAELIKMIQEKEFDASQKAEIVHALAILTRLHQLPLSFIGEMAASNQIAAEWRW